MALRSLDLMIGDWVIFHDSGYASDGTTWEENRVCQIDSIDEDVRVKWYDESGCKEDCPHVSTVFLSPIPLTPEILEKNGFESRKDGYDIGIPLLYWDKYCTAVCGWTHCDDIIEVFDCKYVHELQHALKLCGIEKEIEL